MDVFEKAYGDKNKHKKRIESLAIMAISRMYIDTESDIGKLYQLRVAQNACLWL